MFWAWGWSIFLNRGNESGVRLHLSRTRDWGDNRQVYWVDTSLKRIWGLLDGMTTRRISLWENSCCVQCETQEPQPDEIAKYACWTLQIWRLWTNLFTLLDRKRVYPQKRDKRREYLTQTNVLLSHIKKTTSTMNYEPKNIPRTCNVFVLLYDINQGYYLMIGLKKL